jgi:type I restriction enzyme R subunit
MGFNELNSVEHYIINQLSGVNLNDSNAAEPKVGYRVQWQFKSSDQIKRTVNEVLVESELKAALVRLNPEITSKISCARFLQKSLINQLF